MADITKFTIEKIEGRYLYLKIENIHPDARPLDWLEQQDEKTRRVHALFRLLITLEYNDRQQVSPLYQAIFDRLAPTIEAQENETVELNEYTELAAYGSGMLQDIIDDVVAKAEVFEKDLNDHWEKGLIKNFNPHHTEGAGIPFITIKLTFKNNLTESDLAGTVAYSALMISDEYKY